MVLTISDLKERIGIDFNDMIDEAFTSLRIDVKENRIAYLSRFDALEKEVKLELVRKIERIYNDESEVRKAFSGDCLARDTVAALWTRHWLAGIVTEKMGHHVTENWYDMLYYCKYN